MKKILSIAVLAFVFVIGTYTVSVQAAVIPVTGYAWSNNFGWTKFNTGTGVASPVIITTVSETIGKLSGYAWSDNLGWISFNTGDVNGCPVGSNGSIAPLDGCNPTINMNNGYVTGWARILSIKNYSGDGWIQLSGLNHETNSTGVQYNKTTGAITGYAWSSDMGWINFYNVSSTPVTPPICSIDSITMSGGNAVISATIPNGSWSYVSRDSDSWFDKAKESGNFTSTDSSVVAGNTYVYKISKGASWASAILCASQSFTVPSAPSGSSGLRLLIAASNADLSGLSTNYDDNDHSYETFQVKSGEQFQLKWNIDPALATAGYDLCYGDVSPNSGPTGSWGNNIVSGQTTMNTSGIPKGSYTFNLTCTKGGLSPKTSNTSLKIVSSTIIER